MTDNCIALGVVADAHCNHLTALCTPTNKRASGTHHSSPEQRWMWRRWLDFWGYFGDITKSHGATPYGLFNGDMIDVDVKRRSDQYIEKNETIAKENARNALLPAVDTVEKLWWLRGTPSHVGRSAKHEEDMAQDFSISVPDPNTGTFSWWHALIEFGGVLFDVAHHWTQGKLPWTQPNAANKLAVLVQWHYQDRGYKKLPDIALRSHGHFVGDSGIFSKVRALLTPAWQLKPEYIKASANMRVSDIGGFIFVCQGGEYKFIPRIFEPAKDRVWKASDLSPSAIS